MTINHKSKYCNPEQFWSLQPTEQEIHHLGGREYVDYHLATYGAFHLMVDLLMLRKDFQKLESVLEGTGRTVENIIVEKFDLY